MSSESNGTVTIEEVNITFKGNTVVNLTTNFDNQNYTSGGSTSFLNIIYSNYSINLPYTWTDTLLWYPESLNQSEISPYAQTNSRPIINITWLIRRQANIFGKINETTDCLNFTFNTTGDYDTSFNLTTSYQRIFTNVSIGDENSTIWVWGDMFNCNYTAARYFIKSIDFRSICSDCIG